MTISSSFAVREAGAWLRPRLWRRRAIGPVTTSPGVLKVRSTTMGNAAPLEAGRRLVCLGVRAIGSYLPYAGKNRTKKWPRLGVDARHFGWSMRHATQRGLNSTRCWVAG